jgi:hypothetical protein
MKKKGEKRMKTLMGVGGKYKKEGVQYTDRIIESPIRSQSEQTILFLHSFQDA